MNSDDEIEIKDELEQKKNQFFLSKETQESLKKLIPKIDKKEVMSCKSQESKAADKMLLSFGQIFAKFKDQEELNTAMRILLFIGMKSSFEGDHSKYVIYENYCKDVEPISWERFEDILSKLIGKSILSPLQSIGEILKLTSMSRFLVHNYQKLKLEIIAMKRYGIFEDLFVMVEMIRSFINFEQYGMEIHWIYGLINSLNRFTDKLDKEGRILLEDPEIDEKIREIYKLIDQILEFQNRDNLDDHDLTIQHHVQISVSVFNAVIKLLNLSMDKYDYKLAKSRGVLSLKPYVKMEEFISENFDLIDWKDLFFNCKTCAIPVQYPMKINPYYIKKALINVLRRVEDLEFEELPEGPSSILEENTFIENTVEKSDLIPLKEELMKKAIKFNPDQDYRIVRDKEPRIFLENLRMFYTLSIENKIHLENKFQIIKDTSKNIEKFSARNYKIFTEDVKEES